MCIKFESLSLLAHFTSKSLFSTTLSPPLSLLKITNHQFPARSGLPTNGQVVFNS